jgi:hypothetical protein
MKINNYKKIFIIALCTFIFISAPSISILFAACNANGVDSSTGKLCYVKLEKNAFPGVTNSTDLTSFLGQIFNFGIAIAVALALVMIIWGGILKMTTDSWNKQDEAKSKITNALYGLGIALISWLLLYTINPALVDFKNNTLLNPSKTKTQLKTVEAPLGTETRTQTLENNYNNTIPIPKPVPPPANNNKINK